MGSSSLSTAGFAGVFAAFGTVAFGTSCSFASRPARRKRARFAHHHPWTLQRRLGAGEFSAVWAATRANLDDEYALKISAVPPKNSARKRGRST